MSEEPIHIIKLPPPDVGGYWVGEKPYRYMYMFNFKPPWWHRLWTRFFLGWKWEDNDALSKP